MWLNSTAQDALRAVTFLARQPPDVLLTVGEIAAEIRLPRNYLSKTLNTLRSAGVLHSSRGPRGGFALAIDARKLRLADVIEPFARSSGRCLLGRSTCSDHDPCPAHRRWSEVARRTERFLNETTVADIATGRDIPLY